MVEDGVIRILVAPREHGQRAGDGRHLLVEHFVAEPLGAPDLASLAGEPHLERAEPAIDLGRLEAPAEGAHGESPPAHEGPPGGLAGPEHSSWTHASTAESACSTS